MELTPDEIKEFNRKIVEICENDKSHTKELSAYTGISITEIPDPFEEE